MRLRLLIRDCRPVHCTVSLATAFRAGRLQVMLVRDVALAVSLQLMPGRVARRVARTSSPGSCRTGFASVLIRSLVKSVCTVRTSYVNIRSFGGRWRYHIVTCMDRHIVFKCPDTEMNVQHWLPAVPNDEPKGTHRSVVCAACSKLHFINTSTGKLLGNK